MSLSSEISELIKPLVVKEVNEQMDSLKKEVLDMVHRPEYIGYGRYLNYDQTAKYCGIGKSGLKQKLANKGIYPIEFNAREKVYDRKELDQLNLSSYLEEYKERLHE